MGVYNCENTISAAMDSILSQTYNNWKMIICDDGSTDNTFKIVSDYEKRYPRKIQLIKNEKNMGLSYTLNRCLELVDTEYIARMDGDDISMPDRFEKEIAVLANEPQISIVSCDIDYFDGNRVIGKMSHPTYPTERDLVKENPFCHASSMIKTSAIKSVGGYSERDHYSRIEDYQLWFKLYLSGFRGKNIHEVLYQTRDDIDAYNRRKYKERINSFRLKISIVNKCHMNKWMYIYSLRPLLTGLLPHFLYTILHKKRLNKK